MTVEKTECHDIVTGAGAGLTSFFLPGELDRAFQENEWTLAEMVEILTNIARECSTKVITRKDGTIIEEPVVTPRERMAAIAMLEKKAKDSMVLGGLIQKDQLQVKKTLPDGSEAEFNAEGMRLTREGSSRLQTTLNLLEKASTSNDPEVIDVEVVTNGHDPGNGSSVCTRQSTTDVPGECSNSGPTRGSGDDPRSSSGDGNGNGGGVHEEQRAAARDPFGESENNDQRTIGGANEKRERRVPEQSGGSGQGEAVGDEGGADRRGGSQDSGPPDEPWWGDTYPEEPGELPEGGGINSGACGADESPADVAARTAVAAQNRYLEKRKGRSNPDRTE